MLHQPLPTAPGIGRDSVGLATRTRLVRVLGRVEDVHGELEEEGALEQDGHLGVELGRKGYEDAGAVESALVALPVVVLFVPSFGLGPLRERQARDEHEE